MHPATRAARPSILCTLALLSCCLVTGDLSATHPGWARKYNMSCFTCHAPVPKLNDFGRRFRANGFQLPGTLEEASLWEQKTIPLSLMVHEMLVRKTISNKMPMATGTGIPSGESLRFNSFDNMNLEFFSGGVAAKNLSYFSLWEIEAENELENGEFETKIEVHPAQAFFMYNNILDSGFGQLNARMGLFELDLPFSQIRSISAHSNKYLVYDVAARHHGFQLGASQLGLSVKGRYEGLEYEAAVINGTNDHFDGNDEKDVYLRAAYTIYEPLPLVSDLRFGTLGYAGNENLDSNVSEDNTSSLRWGLDFSVNFTPGINLFGQWLFGRNGDTDGVAAGDQEFEYSGGFLGVDASILPERLFAFTRYDLVDIGDQWNVDPAVVASMGNVDDLHKYTLGLRYHFSESVFGQLEWFKQDNQIGHPGATEGAAIGMNVDASTFMLMLAVTF